MKLKVNDQIPDAKIFHLVDGEPREQNVSEVLGSRASLKPSPKKFKAKRVIVKVRPG